ncbi:hypothetical protein TNCV_5001291 [Trichonephila clavipes]|nr:hypothetical protein TNCV_5001291 [Trichonephila clavipes]
MATGCQPVTWWVRRWWITERLSKEQKQIKGKEQDHFKEPLQTETVAGSSPDATEDPPRRVEDASDIYRGLKSSCWRGGKFIKKNPLKRDRYCFESAMPFTVLLIKLKLCGVTAHEGRAHPGIRDFWVLRSGQLVWGLPKTEKLGKGSMRQLFGNLCSKQSFQEARGFQEASSIENIRAAFSHRHVARAQ